MGVNEGESVICTVLVLWGKARGELSCYVNKDLSEKYHKTLDIVQGFNEKQIKFLL